MADFLETMPKAELHLHLEGSVEPETLHELDPATPIEECRAIYSYPDFDAFPMFTSDGKRLVWASNRNGKEPHETNIFIADWVN